MNFEQGLNNLNDILKHKGLQSDSEEYLNFVGWRRKLQESIEDERRFAGLGSQGQEQRGRVLRELDRLALRYASKTFQDLCAEKPKVYVNQSNAIKILFLAANPIDTVRLRLDLEVRSIEQALRQAEFRDKFDLQQHWAVRVADLQTCLLRHNPNIVHFSGHGSKKSEIILEDDAGNSHSVSGRVLSNLFSVLKENIRCVVLNACYSEQQARAIARHIDCVIGMSMAIGDSAAISFATAFYQALAYGKDVKTAFELGCVQIDLENLEEQDTPQLIAIKTKPEEIVFA